MVTVGITAATLRKLADTGLDHIQISIQDSEETSADHIAGYQGAFTRKRALASEVVNLKIPLTVNAVMHRANIDRLEASIGHQGSRMRNQRFGMMQDLATSRPHQR